MVIITDYRGNVFFFLSNISDVFINESYKNIGHSTSKDEIIFIRNNITLVAFIINDKFWEDAT